VILQDGVRKKTREPTSNIKDGNSKIEDNPQQPLPTQTGPTDISAYGISLRTCVFPEATRQGHRDAHYGWTCRACTTPLRNRAIISFKIKTAKTDEEKLHAKDEGTYQRHRRWQRETQIEKHMKDQVTESKKATANTERIDLRNLLDLVKAIAENEKLVKDLDKELAQGLLLALLEQLPWVPI